MRAADGWDARQLDMIPEPDGMAPDEATQPETADAFDEAGFIATARERMAAGLEADRENRDADLDDRKFRAGEQWPEEVKQQRADRPCLTINRMGQFVRQVTGDIRLNKPAIKVTPAEGGDVDTADVYEGLIRHIEQASKAQRVYVNAADDQVTGGQGYFRVRTEYATWDGWTQDICIRHIRNPLSVVFDPNMEDATGRDAKWCFVYDDLPKEEYRKTYGEDVPASLDVQDAAGTNDTAMPAWGSGDQGMVRIAEYWELREEQSRLVLMSDGSTLKNPDDAALQEKAMAGIMPVSERQSTCPVVWFSMIDGRRILAGPQKMDGFERIPIVRVVGEEVRVGPRVVRHGLIRFAKDPQRMDNYWQSAMVERLALSPKAPYLVSAKMIEGYEDVWRNIATGNPNVLPYNPDPLAPGGKPERIAPAPVEPAMVQQSLMAADNMKAVTGIYDASLGARSNETSGVAIDARKEEGDVGTFVYMDNLADAITEAGRIVVSLIPTVYDTPRQIRILGQDMQPRVLQVNGGGVDLATGKPVPDLTRGKYDVYVQTGPSFASRRAQAAESMLEFTRVFPQAAPFLADLIAKNSDWPDADEVAARMGILVRPMLAQAQMQVQQLQAQSAMMQMGGMGAGGSPAFGPPGPQTTPGLQPA